MELEYAHHPIARGAALAALLLIGVGGQTARAQSATALGLADNLTAHARGQATIAWNPANLDLPGTPGFTVSLLPIRVSASTSPVGVFGLAEAESGSVAAGAKSDWLDRIAAGGRQRGALGADVAGVSVSRGRIGVQFSTSASGALDLRPDAAELLLFGPDGRNGEKHDFDVEGSSLHAAMTSSVAVSYARNIPLHIAAVPFADQHAAIGVTVRYIMGHALFAAAGLGKALPDSLRPALALPLVYSDAADGFDHGAGAAIDLGAAWSAGPLTVGLVLRDALNTFAWDLASLRSRSAAGLLADIDVDGGGPIPNAPPAVRAMAARGIDELTFRPSLATGAALEMPALTVTMGLRHRFDTGLDVEPGTHADLGAEYRPFPYLPLRGGVAIISGGYRAATGSGVEHGPIEFGIAAAHARGAMGRFAALTAPLTFRSN